VSSLPSHLNVTVRAEIDPALDAALTAAQAALDRATDEVITNHPSDAGRWLTLINTIEHEPEYIPLREEYDRQRAISATGAFGRVRYNPPAGSIE
jgi:hypothetical protein